MRLRSIEHPRAHLSAISRTFGARDDHMETRLVDDLLVGAVAGAAATAAMTLAMEAMFRVLPRRSQYPLPPRQVTMKVADEAGLKDDLSESGRRAATLAAHFGYGSTMGALYAAMARRWDEPRPGAGIAWGTTVWAANYLAALPALGLLRPATEHPPERTALMVVAHWIWGAVLETAVRCSREAGGKEC